MTSDRTNAATSVGLESPDLPAPLAALVGEVVRRTRLRRRERAEIAAELTAHFRDGLARGRGVEELSAAFGDLKTSARELRQGAIAKRSAIDRGLRRTLQIVGVSIAAILLVYLAMAIHVARLRPTISFDPIATYQRLLPETEDPAWPHYLESLAWSRSDATLGTPGDPFGTAERRNLFFDAIDRYGAREPGAEAIVSANALDEPVDPIDLRAILAAHGDELAILRQAASMPVLGRRVSTSPQQAIAAEQAYFGTRTAGDVEPSPFADLLLSVLLPQLAEFRHASRLLIAEARLAEEDGDFARAAADLAAIFGIARHAEENRTLVGQLVAAAIRVQASRAIIAMLETGGERFDLDALAELAHAVDSVQASSLRLDMASERLMFEDVLQRMYSDDGDGDGVFIPWAFAEFSTLIDGSERGAGRGSSPIALAVGPLVYLAPGRRETIDQHVRWLAAIEEDSARPWWDDRRTVERIEQEVLFPNRNAPILGGGNVLLRLLLPAVSKANDNLAAQRFDLDGAAIAIALARFHAVHGAWPTSLDALVPEFLPTVPIDPETTLPYRYDLRGTGPVVWSTGPDGIDDGGRPFRGTSTAHPETNDHRDFVRVPAQARQAGTLRKSVLVHRERTGRWPASIEELGEDAPPVDGHERVEYLLVEGEPVIRRVFEDDADPRRRFLAIPSPGDRLLVEWGLGTFGPIPQIRRPDWSG